MLNNENELFVDSYNLSNQLSKQEIYELIDKKRKGDKSYREKIAKHNIRSVLYEVSNKFKNVDYDKKDLVSVGNIGLLKAIDKFDTTRNFEFATYASRCIDNEIITFLDKQKRHKNHDSLDEVIYSNDGKKEISWKDTLVEEKDYFEEYINSEIYPIIREIVMELPANEKEIIMLSFGFYDDKIYTQQEIADRLSIAQSYVSKLLAKIVKKIGYQLEEKGIIEICNRNEEVKKR